jgi:hypothetical protein
MIAAGVPDQCLPHVKGQRTEDQLASDLIAILGTEKPGAARDLLIAAVLMNHGKMPGTLSERAALGRRAGLSRTAAYKVGAEAEGGGHGDNCSTYTRDTASSKSAGKAVTRASRSGTGIPIWGGRRYGWRYS